MQLTIDIKDEVADKILYFLEHFKDDITIIDKNGSDYEYISDDKLQELIKYSNDYKQGKREEFEEYIL